jgi:hypothetical protein
MEISAEIFDNARLLEEEMSSAPKLTSYPGPFVGQTTEKR